MLGVEEFPPTGILSTQIKWQILQNLAIVQLQDQDTQMRQICKTQGIPY
jgi:hypothetical protein